MTEAAGAVAQVSEAAGAAVESVIAEAGAAVEAANERAAAAAEVARLVTEGAVQREITDDVEELDEELEQCRNDLASLRQQVTELASSLTAMQTTLATFVTLEMLTAELAKASPQRSIPPNSSETTEVIAEAPTHQPGAEKEGDQPEAEAKVKQSRYRLT